MINLDKVKMEPIILSKRENGRVQIINGHKRVNILKIMGITELRPNMYTYSDGSYNKDIIHLHDIEEEFI